MIQDSIHSKDSITDFKTYCVKTLNDSFPTLNTKNSLFVVKERAIADNITTKPITANNNSSFIFVIFLFLFLFFALLIRHGAKEFINMIRCCFSRKVFENSLQNGRLINKSLILPVIILYVFIVALMCEKITSVWGIDIGIKQWQFILIAIAGIMIFAFVKWVLFNLSGVLLGRYNAVMLYISNQIVYFALCFPLLIFPIFATFFAKPDIAKLLLYFALIIFALLYVIRLLRGFVLLLKSTYSFGFYLFLYLCSVEIIPLLIAIKVLFSYI